MLYCFPPRSFQHMPLANLHGLNAATAQLAVVDILRRVYALYCYAPPAELGARRSRERAVPRPHRAQLCQRPSANPAAFGPACDVSPLTGDSNCGSRVISTSQAECVITLRPSKLTP